VAAVLAAQRLMLLRPLLAFAGTATLTARQDTPGASNHVKLTYADYAAVCAVKSFEISLEREEIDITTLPCGLGNKGGKYANFRVSQAGYASGTGSMECDFYQRSNQPGESSAG